jgi:hypothetical protein
LLALGQEKRGENAQVGIEVPRDDGRVMDNKHAKAAGELYDRKR